MAGRPPGLSLGLKKAPPPPENNDSDPESLGAIETPAKEFGPLKAGETLEDIFAGKPEAYRSEVFFKIRGGERVGIRKIARRGKFGNWRDDIFLSTIKELKIYKKIISLEGWEDHVLPYTGGALLTNGNTVYLDFDYIEGLDLIDYMKTASKAHVHSILAQVARALKWCYEAGVSHGDIKPDNIYIEVVDGKPKARLFDFGEATIDPRGADMKDDLRAYIHMCTMIGDATAKGLLDVLDVGNSNNAVNGRGLADAYQRMADFWTAQGWGGGRRKQRMTRRKRSIR